MFYRQLAIQQELCRIVHVSMFHDNKSKICLWPQRPPAPLLETLVLHVAANSIAGVEILTTQIAL